MGAKETPSYFFVNRDTQPYEIFFGLRYGRVDYAGCAYDPKHAENACKALNEKKPYAFSATLTTKAINELKEISATIISEPRKLFPGGIATVPDMHSVNSYLVVD
jgi:hypothetical protein